MDEKPQYRPAIARRLRIVGVVVLALAVVLFGLGAWLFGSWRIEQRPTTFDQPLAIPPLAESHTDEQGRTVFDLTAQTGSSQLLPGVDTPTWGYDGAYLGPTLRASPGEEVVVNVTNDLPETTTTHWHGMELPAEMDGGPHQQIAPAATWSPTWTIEQPAGTLWYHPHPHQATAGQVYRGLAGMFLIDDPQLAGVLPETYGVDDIPVIVQDRRFAADGSSEPYTESLRFTGMLGDTIVVNGTVGPVLEATTELVRLRILNASPSRIYSFEFDDRRRFWQIATDVALLPRPTEIDRIQLSPGERAEIVVAIAPGDDVMLRSAHADLGTSFVATRVAGGDDEFDILRVTAASALRPSTPLPAELAAPDQSPPAVVDAAPDRTFVLGDFTINDLTMDHERIDAVVEPGSNETWLVRNDSLQPHNFHIHGSRFLVAGDDLPAFHRGWKDTVYIPPGTAVRLSVELPRFDDADSPYMFHCHLLYHEDNGMMGQFVATLDPAEPESPTDPTTEHEGH